MKNIVLIGFMGAGKTVVGKKLAEKLGYSYLDTDSIIETKQKKSINDIFAEDGEEAFRRMETAVIEKLSHEGKHVISTGGGMILRPENVLIMRKIGPMILLWASPEAIYDRIKDDKNRPLLDVSEPLLKIKEILNFRTPIYKNVADHIVDTSRLSPDDACNRIVKFVRKGK